MKLRKNNPSLSLNEWKRMMQTELNKTLKVLQDIKRDAKDIESGLDVVDDNLDHITQRNDLPDTVDTDDTGNQSDDNPKKPIPANSGSRKRKTEMAL